MGSLPRGTAWADLYARLGPEGHPIYYHARSCTVAEDESFVDEAGFQVMARRSTLQRPPWT